jgi:hypothetical protein
MVRGFFFSFNIHDNQCIAILGVRKLKFLSVYEYLFLCVIGYAADPPWADYNHNGGTKVRLIVDGEVFTVNCEYSLYALRVWKREYFPRHSVTEFNNNGEFRSWQGSQS